MTDRSNKSNPNQRPGQNKPLMLGYAVRPIRDGQKSAWSKIAAAWAHKDGEGFDVRMDALPVDCRLVLRTIQDEDDQGPDVVDREGPSGMG